MTNSIRFDGSTSSAISPTNQTSFNMKYMYLNIGEWTQSNDPLLSIRWGDGRSGNLTSRRSNNPRLLNITGGVYDAGFRAEQNGVIIFQDGDTLRTYYQGAELTSRDSAFPEGVLQTALGQTVQGNAKDDVTIYEIRYGSKELTLQEVIDISNGNLSSINDAEIIYNNFTQEEIDNSLITNNGSLEGQYDLTLQNVEVIDPYVPPIYTIPNDTLPYLVKPKHIDCDSPGFIMLSSTENFNLDVVKLSFLYRQPFSTASRLVSLGSTANNLGNRNMIRLQSTNRLFIQPNGDNNDTSIPAVSLEAPSFRFIPDTYYNMVIKYDTTINNYKVWINGRQIDMGYSEGEQNQRMLVEGICVNNRLTLDRGSNMEFYNVSFEKSQLTDEECRTISRNFTEVLSDISYKASNVSGESIIIPETNNASNDMVGSNATVVEDKLRPLSRILGDGRVIVPLPLAQEEWILTTDGGVVDLSILPQGDYSVTATYNDGPQPFAALSAPGYGMRQSSISQTTFLVDRAFIGVEDSTLAPGAQATTLCIREGKHFFTTEYLSNNGTTAEPYLQSATKDGLLTGSFATNWTIKAKRISNFEREEVYDGGQDIDISQLPVGEYSIIARRKDGSTGSWGLGLNGYTFSNINASRANRQGDYQPLIPIVNSTANTAGTATLSIRMSAHSITNTYITDSLSNNEKAYIHGYKSGKVISGVSSDYEIVIKPIAVLNDPDAITIQRVNNSFDISNLENGDYVLGVVSRFTTSIGYSSLEGSSGRLLFSTFVSSTTSGFSPTFNTTSTAITQSKLIIREGNNILRSYEPSGYSPLRDIIVGDTIGAGFATADYLILKKISA